MKVTVQVGRAKVEFEIPDDNDAWNVAERAVEYVRERYGEEDDDADTHGYISRLIVTRKILDALKP